MKMPYTFHKWGVYTKEWFQNNIQYGIPDKLFLLKHSFLRPLICYGTDKKRTRKTLREEFRSKGIPPRYYSFINGVPEDTLVMCRFGFFLWQCYYVERGIKWDKRIFFTQSQACFYLYYSVLQSLYFDLKEKVKLTPMLSSMEEKVLKNFKYEAKWIMKTGVSHKD